MAELLAEREAKLEVAPASDLVLDELEPKLKTDFGHSSLEPVSRARPMLPAHLRQVNLRILEQQARLGVNADGEQVGEPTGEPAPPPPAAGSGGGGGGRKGVQAIGPAWLRGEIERPAGEKDHGSYVG